MNPDPRLLLLTHPGLGDGLLEAAESILGNRPAVDLLTNRAETDLDAALIAWIEAVPGPALILTDLGFGSCCTAARRVAEGRSNVAIVAGVNLPILLAALRSHDQPDLASLVRHLARRGAEAVETFRASDD